MIEVNYQRNEKLKKWYTQQITAALNGKSSVKQVSDPLLLPLHQKMSMPDQKELTDILLEDKNKLVEKYDWIREYVKLCDFTAYYSELQTLTKEKRIYTPLRIEYLNQYRGYYLNELISVITANHPF